MGTVPTNTGNAAAIAEAERSFRQGSLANARKACEQILAEDPDNVSALNILGGCLARTGQVAQAIRVAEKVCHLSPGDAVPYANLSYLNNVVGNVPQAVLAMAHAVNCDTDGTDYQALFARLTDHLEFYELNAETTVIGQAIELCLANPGIDAEAFSTAWHSLLLLEPDFKRFASITRGGSFEEQSEQLDLAEIASPLTAPFFLLGLRSLHAMDSRLERILTLFRRLFISRFDDYDLKVFLPFLCALAEHCYLNEYVYGCTKEEQGHGGLAGNRRWIFQPKPM